MAYTDFDVWKGLLLINGSLIYLYETGSIQWISIVSCQKGPTHHANIWQIGPFWQDILDI